MKRKITPVMIGIFAIVSVISISFTSSSFGAHDNLMKGWENEFTPEEVQVQQKMESKTIRSVSEVHPGIEDHQFVVILPSDLKFNRYSLFLKILFDFHYRYFIEVKY